jgi:hypothetical protein
MNLNNKSLLRGNLAIVLERVAKGEVIGTIIRFNLQGLTDPKIEGFTIFELHKIYNNSDLLNIIKFYEGVDNPLSGEALEEHLRRLCS